MSLKIEDEIEDFFVFEEQHELFDLRYNNIKVWPVMRVGIFEEIFNEKGLSLGSSQNSDKSRDSKFFSRLFNLFHDFFSLFNIFNNVDILVINNDHKIKNINEEQTTKLVWSIYESLQSDYEIALVNTQAINFRSNRLKPINISTFLSIFTKLSTWLIPNKKWNKIKLYLDSEIFKFYKINLKWEKIYQSVFYRQIVLGHFLNLYLKLKNPKLIIFSDNGQMSSINKVAFNNNIPTIDYQHAVLSDAYIIYNHNQKIVTKYKNYLSRHYFAWGNFRLSGYENNYLCKVVGNAFFEHEMSKYPEVENDIDSLLIVSDGAYTRDDLTELAINISSKFPEKNIFYKLRPEEYQTWKNHYSSEFLDRKNIIKLDNDKLSLYHFLLKSNFTIGTNSTVLLEASPVSKVIVFKKGWFFEMNDYIDSGLFMSGDTSEVIIEIIKSNRISKSQITSNDIFKSNSLDLINISIKEIISNPPSPRD